MVRLEEMFAFVWRISGRRTTASIRSKSSPNAILRSTLAITAFTLLAIMYGCGKKSAPGAVAPIVSVAKPVSRLVNDHMDFTGNNVGIDSVTPVARVEG